jgi:DNA repair protein RecN (Recombination protein N)
MLFSAQLCFSGQVVLLELRLENYAVIEKLAIEFAPGLNLLTGETGAGKSILIDALALLLGAKASPELVRFGAERATLSAAFRLEPSGEKLVSRVLDENGIDPEGEDLILRREIGPKGRVFVNNQPAAAAVLKELAPHLASIHAQNESLVSFDAAARLELVDQFAGVETALLDETFARWTDLRHQIHGLETNDEERLRIFDLWSFQRREIDEAKIEPGEDERLEAERRVLLNAEKIRASAESAFDLLYENQQSASTSLRAAERKLEELISFEPKFQDASVALESARITVEDLATNLRDYAASVESSPERLAEVEERLARLDRLKRKYGPTLEGVRRFSAELAGKLSDFEKRDETLTRLRSELSRAADEYLGLARETSARRREAVKRLRKRVQSAVHELAMNCEFRIELGGTNEPDNWTRTGFDRAEYLISTNPGEPLRPLAEIASGGELSRVMLALKAAVESVAKPGRNPTRTLLFDEIDTGIGGRAAEAVGRKLKALAENHQVLCVTHLPQIAAFADHHYLIEKQHSNGRTRTSVRRLSRDERTSEIARMMSGAKLTEASLKHAEQMIRANA